MWNPMLYEEQKKEKKRKETELGEFGKQKYRGHFLLFLTKYKQKMKGLAITLRLQGGNL